MSAAAGKPAKTGLQAGIRRFSIGEKRPIELTVLKDGTIRMREAGRRHVYVTSVAAVYFSAVRSETLTDIRQRQRRAALLSKAGSGVGR